MISETDRERIAKLPSWVRDLIKRLEVANEPAIEAAVKARREAETLRERSKRLSDANAALMELIGCAGRNGIDWAAKVVEVLEGYEIFKEI